MNDDLSVTLDLFFQNFLAPLNMVDEPVKAEVDKTIEKKFIISCYEKKNETYKCRILVIGGERCQYIRKSGYFLDSPRKNLKNMHTEFFRTGYEDFSKENSDGNLGLFIKKISCNNQIQSKRPIIKNLSLSFDKNLLEEHLIDIFTSSGRPYTIISEPWFQYFIGNESKQF